MAYKLPNLGYEYNALEPHIDAKTMEIHHSKHHNAYVTKLNDALEGSGVDAPECIADLMEKIGDLPDSIQTAVRNNGGGHANHSLFWTVIAPGGDSSPSADLAGAIDTEFGSFDEFKSAFANAAATRFGSGWAWLVAYADGSVKVTSTPNQDNPQMGSAFGYDGGTPILGLDVWEHAYYLNYQNRRPDYINAFWNVVNWSQVSSYYKQAKN